MYANISTPMTAASMFNITQLREMLSDSDIHNTGRSWSFRQSSLYMSLLLMTLIIIQHRLQFALIREAETIRDSIQMQIYFRMFYSVTLT